MSDAEEKFLNGFDNFIKNTNGFLSFENREFDRNAYPEDFFGTEKRSKNYSDYKQYKLVSFSDQGDYLENIFSDYYRSAEYTVNSFCIIYGINQKEIGNNVLCFNVSFYDHSYNGNQKEFYYTLDLNTTEQFGNMIISNDAPLLTMKTQRILSNFCLKVLNKYVENAHNLLPEDILSEMDILNLKVLTPEFKELMLLKYDTYSYFIEDKDLLKEKINKVKLTNDTQISKIQEGLDKITLIEQEYRKKIKNESLNENRKFNL